jgi:endogenous inhibitor of DNA gyrase (YacG/DUF329 family)
VAVQKQATGNWQLAREAAVKCPTCSKATRPREENRTFPFCSERCRMADLGRWLNEEYRIPTDEESEEPPKKGEN